MFEGCCLKIIRLNFSTFNDFKPSSEHDSEAWCFQNAKVQIFSKDASKCLDEMTFVVERNLICWRWFRTSEVSIPLNIVRDHQQLV